MNYLLDTCTVSELRRKTRAHKGVLAWVEATRGSRYFISAVTLLELELGVQRIERKDAAQGAVLRDWLDGQVRETFRGKVLAFDEEAARICAAFHVPDPRPERDAMIAAVAVANSMALVTRNVADFAALKGLTVIDPWA